MRLVRVLVPLLPLVVACTRSGEVPEPAAPTPDPAPQSAAPDAQKVAAEPETTESTVDPSPEAAPESPEPMTMPTECAEGSELCVPPLPFVKELCRGKYPSVAVVMFEKSSPWTRGYVRLEEVDAVNTQGGPSGDQNLTFGEEVIILQDTNANKDGLQVSGGGYFVLRWDGTCATVSDGEVVDYAPGALKNAPVVWKYLDRTLREALLENPNVKNAHALLREECRGERPSQGGPSCQRARRLLNAHLTLAVRSGMHLPPPERLP